MRNVNRLRNGGFVPPGKPPRGRWIASAVILCFGIIVAIGVRALVIKQAGAANTSQHVVERIDLQDALNAAQPGDEIVFTPYGVKLLKNTAAEVAITIDYEKRFQKSTSQEVVLRMTARGGHFALPTFLDSIEARLSGPGIAITPSESQFANPKSFSGLLRDTLEWTWTIRASEPGSYILSVAFPVEILRRVLATKLYRLEQPSFTLRDEKAKQLESNSIVISPEIKLQGNATPQPSGSTNIAFDVTTDSGLSPRQDFYLRGALALFLGLCTIPAISSLIARRSSNSVRASRSRRSPR